jgi:hypothetical protein
MLTIRKDWYKFAILGTTTAITMFLCACGGSSSSGGTPPPTGTAIAVKFAGTAPVAVATQIGTNSWSAASLSSSSLDLTLPEGTTTYGIAYVCSTTQSGVPLNQENIVEATVQDGTTYQVNCAAAASANGTATGSVDATAFPLTANIEVLGLSGYALVTGLTGPFSLTTESATQDIAFVALDSSNNTLAVHILPSQTVPGAINNGATVSFVTTDVVTPQNITVSGVPAGFTGGTQASYVTANGTYIGLTSSTAGQYPTIPTSTQLQTGDYYIIDGYATEASTFQGVDYTTTTTTPSALAVTLPVALTTAAPTPAALPTFDVTYSGFSGVTNVADYGSIAWYTTAPPVTELIIEVTATAAYQNGATTLAIPDLSAISKFIAGPASGTTVYWGDGVLSGTYQTYTPQPTNGTLSSAYYNNDMFVVP